MIVSCEVGQLVSIYTENSYESFDLDFVTLGDRKKIEEVMHSLGFRNDRSRLFQHPKTKFLVEFPGSAFQVGDELITSFREMETPYGVLKLLTPTDCLKDRRCAFYHWNDRQGLEQAVLVAQSHPVKLSSIKSWSRREGHADKCELFLKMLKETKRGAVKRR